MVKFNHRISPVRQRHGSADTLPKQFLSGERVWFSGHFRFPADFLRETPRFPGRNHKILHLPGAARDWSGEQNHDHRAEMKSVSIP